MTLPAFGRAAYPATYPPWRHAAFIVIDAGFAWLFVLKPDWLIAPYLLLTVQILNGHGRAAWSLWRTSGRADWISLVSVTASLLGLALLVADWRARRWRSASVLGARRGDGPTSHGLAASTFTLTRGAILLATGLTGLSMLLYPGGTLLDPTTRGYSFFHNSLSDLGSTVAWGGQANTAGALFFTCGFCLVAIGCGACAVAMVHLYTASPASRTSARAAAALGLFSCAALAGAALTPQDLDLGLHRELSTAALFSGTGTTMLMALAAANEPRIRRRMSVSYLVLGATLGVWLCVARAMPLTDAGFSIAVSLQKLVALTLVITLWLQTGEAGRIARSKTQRQLDVQESL